METLTDKTGNLRERVIANLNGLARKRARKIHFTNSFSTLQSIIDTSHWPNRIRSCRTREPDDIILRVIC